MLSAYEQLRAVNIARNKRVLLGLGIKPREKKSNKRPAAGILPHEKKSKKRRRRKASPTRHSPRVATQATVNYFPDGDEDHDDEDGDEHDDDEYGLDALFGPDDEDEEDEEDAPRRRHATSNKRLAASPGDDSAAIAEAIPDEVQRYVRTLYLELQKPQSKLQWNADGASFCVDVSSGPPHPHAHAHAHAHGACTRTCTHLHTRNRTRIHRPAKIHI